jgi:phosphoribosylamine---glycine ligase
MRRIAIVGTGGREAALKWRLEQDDPSLDVRLVPAGRVPEILDAVETLKADFTIVGPEAPLALGVVDIFRERTAKDPRRAIFGPTAMAALIEASKSFAKEVMRDAGIPTAEAKVFSTAREAFAYLNQLEAKGRGEHPIVVKANGLAAGKGVTVCRNLKEALAAVRDLMVTRTLKAAGNVVLLEEYLEGEECSVLAFCDGVNAVLLGSARDYKRLKDGDRGPNTGGMGAYSPLPWLTSFEEEQILESIFLPTLRAMDKQSTPYHGLLYAGLMLTADGPKVVEFNCRFGDPETQVLVSRMEPGQLLDLMVATTSHGGLGGKSVRLNRTAAVCVTLAAEGYPDSPRKGDEVMGLEKTRGEENVLVFEAGMEWRDDYALTNGGRVCHVVGIDQNGYLDRARARANMAAEMIGFDGKQYRTDIAQHLPALLRRPKETNVPGVAGRNFFYTLSYSGKLPASKFTFV